MNLTNSKQRSPVDSETPHRSQCHCDIRLRPQRQRPGPLNRHRLPAPPTMHITSNCVSAEEKLDSDWDYSIKKNWNDMPNKIISISFNFIFLQIHATINNYTKDSLEQPSQTSMDVQFPLQQMKLSSIVASWLQINHNELTCAMYPGEEAWIWFSTVGIWPVQEKSHSISTIIIIIIILTLHQ